MGPSAQPRPISKAFRDSYLPGEIAPQLGAPKLNAPELSTTVPIEVEWLMSAPNSAATGRSDSRTSRWVDLRACRREATAQTDDDCHTISLALQSTNLTLESDGRCVHDGAVTLGMVQVGSPAAALRGVFHAPCDFLHLRLANGVLAECHEAMHQRPWPGELALADSGFRRDAAIEQLTRALLAAQTAEGELSCLYVEGIATAVVARLIALGSDDVPSSRSRVSALAKWRLKRVVDFIEANLARPLLLTDIAAASGLTRMHFAAQFRVATGLRPRDYLLRRRIERAQALLRDTELPMGEVAFKVGFPNQAHFSMVFRRLAGLTPRQWRLREKALR
ncbi:MAG: helix-turn-helix transcriptional regulator [Alphaproteobacteria bacterium]|nr:helix-turn-helix transcriptional regulator [Alphaproteobacteria bacterium]